MPVPGAVLRDFPLLNSLPPQTLARLAETAQERTVTKREVVLQKGSAAQFLCFLAEGRLQGVDFTVDGREVGIYFIDSGDYFGELAVIDGRDQPEFIVSVARSRVIFLPRQIVRPLLFTDPAIAEQVGSRLAKRLRDSAAQRKILGMANPLQRISAQLTQLAQQSSQALQAAKIPKAKIIINAPTHQELAIMINLSRETVTRAFQVLQAKGLVIREGNNLVIQQPEQMDDLASGKANPAKNSSSPGRGGSQDT
jgi:CRP/FNR family cyclic AMP-dependent transcriptional regulator